MKYYIISEIELEGTDSLKSIDVGYTEDINIANEINEAYDSGLGKFLGENRTKLEIGEVSISTFFVDVDSVNEARTEVENVEELNIVHITNLNQL